MRLLSAVAIAVGIGAMVGLIFTLGALPAFCIFFVIWANNVSRIR